jgi:hypothetical protein
MIIANLNENLTTDMIFKNSTILDFKVLELTNYKGGYDFEDCCCGDTCSCGHGHNRIELNENMLNSEINENITFDNTMIYELNNINSMENIILENSNINIPLFFFRFIFIILIIGIIEFCDG